jgi:hypothetical protein
MFKRAHPSIQIGDRFRNVSDPHGVQWEVVHMWTAVDGILHARVAAVIQTRSELRTIGVPTLADPHFWVPVGRTNPRE